MKRFLCVLALISSLIHAKNDNNNDPMPDQTQNILSLTPIIKIYGPQGTIHYGLDSDVVAAVYPDLVMQVGDHKIINYSQFISIIISQIQQLQQNNNNQKALIEEQNRKIEELSSELRK